MQHVLRHRFSILLAAVIGLSVNALAGFAGTGRATTTGTPVKVVTGIVLHAASGHAMAVSPGDTGAASAMCPASYNYLISGGYSASGTYNSLLAPPSVLTSKPEAASPYWSVHLVNPKTAGTVDVTAVALCAHINYATVMSG